jgi:hypothetical protein
MIKPDKRLILSIPCAWPFERYTTYAQNINFNIKAIVKWRYLVPLSYLENNKNKYYQFCIKYRTVYYRTTKRSISTIQ